MPVQRFVLATSLFGDLLDLVLGVLWWEAAGVIARVERSHVRIVGTRAAFLSHTVVIRRGVVRPQACRMVRPPSPRSNAPVPDRARPPGGMDPAGQVWGPSPSRVVIPERDLSNLQRAPSRTWTTTSWVAILGIGTRWCTSSSSWPS